MKPWYKSKTLWFNLIMAGLAALEASFSFLQPLIPEVYYGIFITILTIGNALLRVISTKTLFFKE
jgi:uncharacterized integral membrane protein